MKAGFTGTRDGMTEAQEKTFRALMRTLPISVLHHGCNEQGSDEDANDIAREERVQTAGHPTHWYQNGLTVDFMFPPKEPLARDEDIAKAGDLLIVTPKGTKEVRRSGTWTTVRRARRHRKAVLFIWPDGTLGGEENDAWSRLKD